MKFSKFLRTYFFTEEFQWLLLNFNSCFQRSSKQKPVGVSAINTRFTWKKVFAAAKIQKHPLQMSYKRKPARAKTGGEYYEIFKYLFWKVSVNSYFWKSATQWQREIIPEFHYSFKPKFAMAEWFCYVTCFANVFPLLFFYSRTWYFYHKKVVS